MGLVCWELNVLQQWMLSDCMWTFGHLHLPACSSSISLPRKHGTAHHSWKTPRKKAHHKFIFIFWYFSQMFQSLHYCRRYVVQMFPLVLYLCRFESSKALSTTFHWAASLYGAYLVGAALDACLEQWQRRRWRNQRGWTKVLPFFTIDSWVELLAEALSWHKSGDLFDGLSIKDMQNTQAIH